MKLTEIELAELTRYCKEYDFSEYLKEKTILVTGSKGIVGTGVIKWLLFLNETKNVNLSIVASTRNPQELPEYIETKDRISYCRFGQEKEYCKSLTIDYIIHAASPTGNSFHATNPVESLRIIVDETEKILELATEQNGCSMIYISSEEIYGLTDTDKPLTEDYVGNIDSLSQRSCYPLGKKVAELLCYNYFLEYNVDVKIIRPTVIQGLFQKYSEERVVNEILRCIIENKNLRMKSAGLTRKCLMYSLDAIAAIFVVLIKGKQGEAYNASNPDTYFSVSDLANYLFDAFSPQLSVEYANKDTSVEEGYLPQRSLLQSIDKIVQLGWRPITNLKQIYAVDIQRFTEKGDL